MIAIFIAGYIILLCVLSIEYRSMWIFIVGILLGPIILFLLTRLLDLFEKLMEGRVSDEVSSPNNQPARFPRDTFTKKVLGRSAKEIIDLIGKPDEAHESLEVLQSFIYRNVTINPYTGKYDSITTVNFTSGVATSISY